MRMQDWSNTILFIHLDTTQAYDGQTDGQKCCCYYSAQHCGVCKNYCGHTSSCYPSVDYADNVSLVVLFLVVSVGKDLTLR